MQLKTDGYAAIRYNGDTLRIDNIDTHIDVCGDDYFVGESWGEAARWEVLGNTIVIMPDGSLQGECGDMEDPGTMEQIAFEILRARAKTTGNEYTITSDTTEL